MPSQVSPGSVPGNLEGVGDASPIESSSNVCYHGAQKLLGEGGRPHCAFELLHLNSDIQEDHASIICSAALLLDYQRFLDLQFTTVQQYSTSCSVNSTTWLPVSAFSNSSHLEGAAHNDVPSLQELTCMWQTAEAVTLLGCLSSVSFKSLPSFVPLL